jgi:hypothetical protein
VITRSSSALSPSSISAEDFILATTRGFTDACAAADANGNGILSRREGRALPAIFHDTFMLYSRMYQGAVEIAPMVADVAEDIRMFAALADRDDDGQISASESEWLPSTLRDNWAALSL